MTEARVLYAALNNFKINKDQIGIAIFIFGIKEKKESEICI